MISNKVVSNRLLFTMAMLAIAHLPFLVVQMCRLWRLEHYQFFPLALGTFVWFLKNRVYRKCFRWDSSNTCLLAIDLILLAAGIFLFSPWLVHVAAIILCLAVCRACFDIHYERRLTYLILLPLITLRLPLGADLRIINWLQSTTTRAASLLLDFFGYLHVREGNTLEFPGKQFLVAEACSGVQSLFAVLFVACLIVCGYRRNWLHSLLVLASAAGFAGLMNVLRICAISLAWVDYRMDLSLGLEHEVLGYAALVAATFLLFSADAFWGIVLDAVPDSRGKGLSQLFRNPLTVAWNHLFRLRSRKSPPLASTGLLADSLHGTLASFAGLVCLVSVLLQLVRL